MASRELALVRDDPRDDELAPCGERRRDGEQRTERLVARRRDEHGAAGCGAGLRHAELERGVLREDRVLERAAAAPTGSIPKLDTSCARVSRYTSSASAWRPER